MFDFRRILWWVFFLAMFLIGMVLGLSACGASPYAITRAELRDTIFSVEPRNNGTTVVWFVHDDVGSYCTRDAELASRINEIFSDLTQPPDVLATYRTLNNNDPEYGLFHTGGCASETGSTTGHTTYLLLDIQRVSERE